jgi:hypothetical protein
MAKSANSPKSKLFGIVACLKTGLAEFSHPLDQCSQARCHFQVPPLIINVRWKQMLARPLVEDVHINKKLLGRTIEVPGQAGIRSDPKPALT